MARKRCLSTPPPPHTQKKSQALGQQDGGCYEAPKSKPGPTAGKGTGTFCPNILLGQVQHEIIDEQRLQWRGPRGRGQVVPPSPATLGQGSALSQCLEDREVGKDQEPSSSLSPSTQCLSSFDSIAHLLPDQCRDGDIPLLPPKQHAPSTPTGLCQWDIWVIIPGSAEARMSSGDPCDFCGRVCRTDPAHPTLPHCLSAPGTSIPLP